MSTESASRTGLQEEGPDEKNLRIGEDGYMFVGAVSGFAALLFYPPVFGVISIICGVQLFRRHSEPLRLAMMGWAGVGLALGMSLSARLWV